ncbi:hypothetical protein [Paludisphaera rhizosphaerae]|uniref:hypothetical protein n=1 Tax=Paludisphaera rhizosphaerae TaxID=2711216 RepID=UPI0013EDF476|nr:hypothetical protein [Paludisphaera rhizosphaerae]
MRYVKGPTFGVPAIIPPVNQDGKTDVEPEPFWDDNARQLTVVTPKYDPEKETAPAQALVFLILPGSALLKASADDIVNATLPRTTTDINSDPAGGVTVPLPLPPYDEKLAYVGQLVYGYQDTDVA